MRADRVASTFRWKLLSALGALPLLAIILSAQETRTVLDGVYTEEQAKRGETIYIDHCVRCHGPKLLGGNEVGALTGPVFNGNWDGVPLGQMLDRVRVTMPLDKPSTMSRQQIADVLSYIFSFNKIPAGKSELPRNAEMLNLIQYKSPKTPNSQLPTPNSQLPTPNSQLPTPQLPNSQLPTPNPQLPTPKLTSVGAGRRLGRTG
jgi:mono/diheme cytochrome c family protein